MSGDETAHEHLESGDLTVAGLRSNLLGMLPSLTIAWSIFGRQVGFITGFDSALRGRQQRSRRISHDGSM